MGNLSAADLARLVALEKAATAAPWVDACNKIGADGAGIAEIDFDSDADRALVIQLRNAAPSLLAEVGRLRAERKARGSALLAGRLSALREAACDVCDFCGRRAYPNDRDMHVLHGPNEAGNYTHERFGSSKLCPASSIHSRIRFETAALSPSPEVGT